MQKLLLILVLSGVSFCAFAQLTIIVTAIPSNTPANPNIYVAGNFNTWNPADPASQLASLGNGQYSITINPAPGLLEFKFTRGSWATVEGNTNGGYLPNRTYQYNGQATVLTLAIASWEDIGGTNSTAAANVHLLDDNFYIPQLNRTRRLWVYLPPDYDSGNKNYPVLYMHDGQNLFDDATSFAGEWHVDESLNTLFQQGDYGCIVVGIDNGGADRINEYCPWVNPQYGGGEGDLYIQFIANTLKPHIDSLYRTLPGRNTTGIMGSSLGGLISMYGLIERQDVFSKAGIFSPAFWINGSEPANHVTTTGKTADVRVYFLAGGQEPAYVAQDMAAVANAMLSVGFSANEQISLVPPLGQHNEAFWSSEFAAAYIWLFAGAVPSFQPVQQLAPLQVFPNPAGDWIRFSGNNGEAPLNVQIFGADGKMWRDTTVAGTAPVWTGDLPAGFYNVRAHTSGGPWQLGKFIRK